MILSDFTHRAPLRDDETPTTIMVPSGKSLMQFYSAATVYARKGNVNAEPPLAGEVPVNDGSASFPYPGGAIYGIAVAGGQRYTFVTDHMAGTLYVAFE